jgi:hypothetical protein
MPNPRRRRHLEAPAYAKDASASMRKLGPRNCREAVDLATEKGWL